MKFPPSVIGCLFWIYLIESCIPKCPNPECKNCHDRS